MKIRIKLLLVSSISIAVSLCFYGCKNWKYDVEKNGISFNKIHQSERGTYTGYMSEKHSIHGFPCEEGWIHFKEDWQLASFQLSKDFRYKNTLYPAHTWFHFPSHDDQPRYICSFPQDYEVQGYLCGGSGGYKGTHTVFYESGKLKSFFAPEDVIIAGVPCEASLFVSIKLFENGNIKSCKLAEDYQANGKAYKRGKTVEFDISGNLK